MRIGTLSAPTGAGKTYAASKYAVDVSDLGFNVLITQPSIILLEQTKAEILKLSPDANVKLLHADDGTREPVVPRIVAMFREAKRDDGRILLISHAAFERVPYFDDKRDWNLLYDEAPTILWRENFKFSKNGKQLLDLLRVEADVEAPNYYRIFTTSKKQAGEIAKSGFEDVINEIFANLCAKLPSDHHRLYVNKQQFDSFHSYVLSGDEAEEKALTVYGLLSPDVFEEWKQVCILGANLDGQTAIQYWREKHGVEFREAKRLRENLRYTEHTNGALLDVYYFMEGNWSKKIRNALVNDERAHDLMAMAAMEVINGEPHVYMENVGYDPYRTFSSEAIKSLGSFEQLPNITHGLNKFEHYKNAVIYSALNPPPDHFRFLEEVAGVKPEAVRASLYHEAVYQAAGRIALRDPKNTERIKVVVADRAAADALAERYPGASIQQLPGAKIDGLLTEGKKPRGRPKKWESEAERKRAERARKKEKK